MRTPRSSRSTARPAHIVHLLSGLAVGGKERVALLLAQRAVACGNRVSLVLYDTPFRSIGEDFDPGDLLTLHLRRGRGIDLAFAIRLGRLFRNLRADVVHAHNGTALFYAVLAAAWAVPANPRVVATFHAWPTHGGRVARWLARGSGLLAAVTAVSDDLARRLVDAGWLSRCGVVWNGVDTDRYAPAGPAGGWRERLGVGCGTFLVGHVGRFDPVKRHLDLLTAARMLRRERPDVAFALIGQGPLLDLVRSEAAGLPNVRFVRHVTDMPPLLRSLDALVLCSSHEAAPLALLEGMACGLPVVATAVGGVPHILRGGGGTEDCGLLVPAGDPASLARAIRFLADDTARRQRLAAAARRRALDFRFEEQWAAYAGLYSGQARVMARNVAPHTENGSAGA